jgi:hypothetical protein
MAKQTITGLFQTRREAELAVEHMVQDYGLDRSRRGAGRRGGEYLRH